MAKKAKIEEPQETDAPVKPKAKVVRKSVKKPAVDAEPISAKKPTKTKAASKTSKKVVVKKSTLKPKPKRVRKPHATRPTPREMAEIENRRFLVWDLYKAGANFRQISEHLKAKGIKGTSLGSVFADVQYCLSLQHTSLSLSVQDHIENEIAVINDVQFNFYPMMQNTNYLFDVRADAAGLVLNCVKERAKLRNLYKAKEIKLNVDDELARLLGISPEELPETDVVESKD